jgi:hypothetical protein
LVITGANFAGGNAGGRFAVVAANSTCLTPAGPLLAPGGTCTINVTFTPGGARTAAARAATLVIAGDGTPATVSVGLTATGR